MDEDATEVIEKLQQTQQGTMIISLDFELIWGVHDIYGLEKYNEHIIGAHQAVEEMLHLFTQYQIHATWGIVGLLYCKDTHNLLETLPAVKPTYEQKQLSAYHVIEHEINKMHHHKLYFAPLLIDHIQATPNQEIATHTFSHYYTLAEGQTIEQFSADLDAAIQIAHRKQHPITSIIFPRNQISDTHLKVCSEKEFTTYRGNELGTIYQMTANERNNIWKRGLRFMDRYINLFGHQTYRLPDIKNMGMLNLRSSRFLHPYTRTFRALEPLRLRRVKQAMTYAAKHGEVFHLWWHPHNFGVHQQKQVLILTDILEHFTSLQQQYGFMSKNMGDVTVELQSVDL